MRPVWAGDLLRLYFHLRFQRRPGRKLKYYRQIAQIQALATGGRRTGDRNTSLLSVTG